MNLVENVTLQNPKPCEDYLSQNTPGPCVTYRELQRTSTVLDVEDEQKLKRTVLFDAHI